ncbi:amidohydrolase [Inediibacterium massiliense]|uniref:amidohydrolase n=1 Tax=Inediibacterium massiliense TaxID=1658111 RepID=UPI0006B44C3A|nr:amidohydrolase [Inediibacterium massiliense]
MDLILKNGKIATLDSKNSIVEAIGVKDGKIIVLGKNHEVLEYKEKDTKVIDVDQKLVLPGFQDGHMHMLNYGYTKQKLILNECASIQDLIEKGKKFILSKNIQKGKWLLGRGWNQDYFIDPVFPNQGNLDEISKEHPICYTRVCGHIAVANTYAINMLKNRYGKIDNENIDWELGIFKESALEMLYGMIDIPSVEDIEKMLMDASLDLIKCGITSVQTDDFDAMPDRDFKKVLKAYEGLIQKDKLPIRVYEQCLLPRKEQLTEFLNLGYHTGYGNEKFRIGPLKLLLDGSLGARTAFMRDGYADDPSTKGICVYTQDQLNKIVFYAHENGMQIAIHAIGDEAMYMALDSFLYANQRLKREDSRHGIVHCQITNKEIINRLSKENILAYIQPIFLDYDLHIVEDRVGVQKAKETYNWKSMLEKGVKVIGGSDAPVVDFNIMKNIYSAVTRQDLKGNPEGGWLPNEKLSIEEGIKLFTKYPPFASFEESQKGILEVGKLADMVILSEDLYTIKEEEIKNVDVLMTIVGGKIIYER